jgi:hypothetical protein
MSTKARIEHVFNCSPETYWTKIFFDEEYNRRTFLEALGFESWKQVSLDETEAETKRVVDAVPKMAVLPAPLKKFAESGLGYREVATFDKKGRRLKIEVEPSSLKGKLSISGTITCEPAGDSKCRRVYETTIEAKVFGVGGMIEKRILQDVEKSYAEAAVFTNKFIAEKGL